MSLDQNPFPVDDADRHEPWELLVRRDIDAFVARDWKRHEVDFLPGLFFGINARKSLSPEAWPYDIWAVRK
jgi:hypothetical protein